MSVAEQPLASLLPEREWKARLSLGFSLRQQRTVLSKRKHVGPLVVQRPFYPEADVCHVYLIHPPGGVVGGDNLQVDVVLDENTHVLITTPSAGKFYRSGLLTGQQKQLLKIEKNACLEWLPQETIFFNGCNSVLETVIHCEQGADFCGWEINCLGRPAADELFTDGQITQSIKLYREGLPVFIERNVIKGGSELLTSACGFNAQTVFATFIATSMNQEACELLQQTWHEKNIKQVSITLINDVLVCRYLGQSADQAKKIFSEIWPVIRQQQKQLAICAPRIWST